MEQKEIPVGSGVYTPLGRGQVVYRLPDGSFVVQFPHGGGQIFQPEEIFQSVVSQGTVWKVGQHAGQQGGY